jgi:putative FmdB family regulatory protein
MPTYDYECRECGHLWELFQQMKDSPKRKCPECGRLRARRLIGPGAGIIFKGSGFYQTDYRSQGYKDAAKADKQAEKSANEKPKSDSDSSKSDAKPKSDSGSS